MCESLYKLLLNGRQIFFPKIKGGLGQEHWKF